MPVDTQTQIPAFPFDRTDDLAPPREYELLRGNAPAARVTLYNGAEAWLLTRYEDVKATLSDHRFSAAARNPGFPFVSAALRASVGQKHIPFLRLDPPEHDRLRRMLSREFIVKRIDGLRPAIESIVDRFIEQLLAAGEPADLISNFALPIPSAVIAELLGVPYSDHEYFQERGRRMLSSNSPWRRVRARSWSCANISANWPTANWRIPATMCSPDWCSNASPPVNCTERI